MESCVLVIDADSIISVGSIYAYKMVYGYVRNAWIEKFGGDPVTASEMIAEVKRHIDQSGDSGVFTDAQILEFINEGYVDLCRYAQLLEKTSEVTTEAYQTLLSIPSDFIESRQFRWGSRKQLYPKDERELDWDQGPWLFRIAGEPDNLVYTNYNRVQLTPIPNAAGTVKMIHSYIPSDLTSSDTPNIIKVWHSAITDFAESTCFVVLKEYDNATRKYGQYTRKRTKIKSHARRGQRTPDTMQSQRHVDVFNYPKWDQGYRSR